MADDAQNPVEIQQRIDAVRREYETLRDGLERRLERHFVDASDVADRLLSVTDEFGRERAVELLAERPDDYGVRVNAGEAGLRDAAADYAADLDRLVETHEQLDDLTLQREKATENVKQALARVVNIQGREYEFDALRRELRERATGERHPVDVPEDRKLTLTERAALGSKAEKAEPYPERDRTRDR